VHYLVVGFLVMLGAMAAVASAPVIFAVAVGAMKMLLVLLLVGVIAGVVWYIRLLSIGEIRPSACSEEGRFRRSGVPKGPAARS